jgi:soluble lytic murein transglycosylase-like protein
MTIRTIAGAGIVLAAALLGAAPALANADPLAFFQTAAAPATAPAAERGPSARASARASGPAASAVIAAAAKLGVPQGLALAVCQVETRCRFGLVGRQGERGPMQIKLQTARGLGYSGSAAGLNGAEGAYWGVKHLAVAYKKCGTARGAARLHQAGLAAGCGGSGYASRVMAQM